MNSISYDIETEKLVTGSIAAAGQSVDISGPNSGTDVVQVSGTWSGTLVVEGSNDGTNFVSLPLIQQSTGFLVSSMTTSDVYIVASNGYNQERVRASAWTSGTATVIDYGSNYPSIVYLTYDRGYGTADDNTIRTAAQVGNATGAADFNAGATGAQTLRTVSNQGAPNTAANAWLAKVTDGTNIVAVKPASTAAAVADPAMVVSLSPNSPLPAGTNTIGTVIANEDKNYGTVGSNTLRTAAQVGNATGAADFNTGSTGAQTLRVHANQGAAAITSGAWPTKITDGTNIASVSTNSDVGVADGLGSGGVNGNLVLTSANTAYEAKVGGSRLAARKSLTITPIDTTVYWGYSNAVTTSNGTPIFKNQFTEFCLDPTDSSVQIWLVCGSAGKNVRITECP